MQGERSTLKNTHSALAHAAAGSVVRITAQVASLGCGVLVMAYLTRRLGLADYGRYALTILLSNWIGIAVGAMTGGSTVRLVAGSQDGRRYAVTILRLVALFGVAAGGLLYLGAGQLARLVNAQGITPFLEVMALNAPIGALAGVYAAILTAQGRLGLIALFTAIGLPVQLTMVLLLVGHGWGIRGAVTAIVISSVVQLVLGFLMTGISPFNRSRVTFADLWAHSRLIAGAQVAMQVVQGIDLILVKYFLGSASIAGLYAGAQNIGFASMMLFNPSSGIVLQSLSKSRLYDRTEEGARTAVSYLRVAMIYAGLLVALSALSGRIVLFLLGANFYPSSTVLMVLLWAAACRIVSMSGRTLVFSAGERLSILPSLLALLAAGVLFYALVLPRYGINGGACVTAGISLTLAVITLREGINLTRIRFPWWTLFRVSVAGGLTALLSYQVRHIGISVLLLLAFATCFYGALLVVMREWTPRREHFSVILAGAAGLLHRAREPKHEPKPMGMENLSAQSASKRRSTEP